MKTGIPLVLALVLILTGLPPVSNAQVGACCFPDGSCQDLEFFDCLVAGGEPGAPGQMCAETICPAPDRDWGDAPDPTYPTYEISGGAAHTLVGGGVILGASADSETDGLPTDHADGDDQDSTDDEDGIFFTQVLLPGSNATLTVIAPIGGKLDAWIDFDRNGNWDHPSEQLFGGSLTLASGTTTGVVYSVPANASRGPTFARFRISSVGSLPPTGFADDGEVEDYETLIGELDWGDAPDIPYPTMEVNDGARHVIDPALRLGSVVDAESDGQPNTQASGDDLDGLADEDSLTAISSLLPGQPATMDITVTGNGMLDAWLDFDGNGVWELSEHLFGGSAVAVVNGLNAGLSFAVPPEAPPGVTFLRLRLSAAGGLTPTGLALDGEVEDHRVDIEGLDWGDAADPSYPTLASGNGAWHVITPGYVLGTVIDHEVDGQPTATADGDDLDGTDDEDGVLFLSPIVQGQSMTIELTGGASNCFVDGWIDLNHSGSWEPPEHVSDGDSIPLSAFQTTNISVAIPIHVKPGTTYVRFRVSRDGGLPMTGFAPEGEVEDYEVIIRGLDWGDAPDTPYPTLGVSNGARHLPHATIYFGSLLDAEADGQPDPQAKGDDLANIDDEDGISFSGALIPGQTGEVNITVGPGGGVVDAWIDFNGNGAWENTERLFGPGGLSLTGGSHPGQTFAVPADAVPGSTFARFRISSNGALAPTGYAPNGEVEDYEVVIEALDWGDAPDPTFPTLRASSGAYHVVTPTLQLGPLVDGEIDGQPHSGALGDDLANQADEDGVVFTTLLIPGEQGCMDVTAGISGGKLDAWIDFNGNGTWDHPAEHLFGSSLALSAGLNAGLCFTVPASAAVGPTFARFRVSLNGGLSPSGFAPNGEVEDYTTEVVHLDWGDAPDPSYSTLSVNGGPSHIIRAGYQLGAAIDDETDGIPNAGATGDDLSNLDDEDGVTFPAVLIRGGVNCVTAVAGASGGVLNGWIDFDANGVFDHPSERLFAGTGMGLAPGINSNVCFSVPWTAVMAPTFARFRLSSTGGLSPTGLANDGEVEDYGDIQVLQPRPSGTVFITDLTGSVSNETATVTWNAESNILYQAQFTAYLPMQSIPTWTNMGAAVLGPANEQTDLDATVPNKVYRVIVPSVP